MERVWKLRGELSRFLEEIGTNDAQNHLTFITSEGNLLDLAFLVDMMGHLNDLNVQLQGNLKLYSNVNTMNTADKYVIIKNLDQIN